MPQLQPRIEEFETNVASAAPLGAFGEVATLGGDIAWADSPARQMHERLLESFAAPKPRTADDRYPMLGRFTVIVGGSIALWAMIGWGIATAVA